MSLIIAASLVVVGQQPGQISVDEFKAKYKQAYAETSARYTNLHIRESKVLGGGQVYKREGYINGDFIKIVTSDSQYTWVQLLSKKSSMRVRSSDGGQSWTLMEHLQLNDVGYESRRPQVLRMLPEAFYLPFNLGGGPAQRFLDVLEGRPANHAMVAGGKLEIKPASEQPRSAVRVTKLEELPSPGALRYRAYMGYLQEDKWVEESYVELDPKLNWLITKRHTHRTGFSQGVAGTIEYGDKVNGVPIMKKYTHYHVGYDPMTGAEFAVEDSKPTVVTVELAEPYEHVNPEEFEAAFYSVEIPKIYDPNQKPETPAVLYYLVAGVVAFIAIVLAFHYARLHWKAKVVTPAPPTP